MNQGTCWCSLCRARGEWGVGSTTCDVHAANNYRSINPPIVASELFKGPPKPKSQPKPVRVYDGAKRSSLPAPSPPPTLTPEELEYLAEER